MRDYKIYPNELFTIKVILLAQDGEYEYLQQYVEFFENKNYLRLALESLQEKGIILKSYKIQVALLLILFLNSLHQE